MILSHLVIFFFFNDTATTEIYTLSLHDALPIYAGARPVILSDAAQKILRGQLEAQRSEWVFPNPDGRPYDRSYIGRAFRKADRKSTRLNSSHGYISYAVFCLKKKKDKLQQHHLR